MDDFLKSKIDYVLSLFYVGKNATRDDLINMFFISIHNRWMSFFMADAEVDTMGKPNTSMSNKLVQTNKMGGFGVMKNVTDIQVLALAIVFERLKSHGALPEVHDNTRTTGIGTAKWIFNIGEGKISGKNDGHAQFNLKFLVSMRKYTLIKHGMGYKPFFSLYLRMLFQAGVIEEFSNDALDSALDSDDMEDDIDKEVDRVLNF
ncbi:armadillo-type fold protein [Artemisia annua]|uniref:Armadillo-type fold protein n=1 Tax=Artemisia annua TaxID=35608 RepID=A0A2U1NNN0_ARTAN|nr:armadillo-type fold protein [Artemisia annua]